jgi:hypothetical protein
VSLVFGCLNLAYEALSFIKVEPAHLKVNGHSCSVEEKGLFEREGLRT